MPREAYEVADESLVDGTPLTAEALERLEAELKAKLERERLVFPKNGGVYFD